VCVSNKILWLRHIFEYAFWRFVYRFLSPTLSSFPTFLLRFLLSICLPFTRAQRTAEISDIVANKLIYYYFLLGIRNFWRLLSMYNASYAWYAFNWNLLWPAYWICSAEYLLKLPGCLQKHSENSVKYFL